MSYGSQPPPPPGWYPDERGQTRYWDGSAWTPHTAAPSASYRPPPSAVPPGPPPRKISRTVWPWVLAVVAVIAAVATAVSIAAVHDNTKTTAVNNSAGTTQLPSGTLTSASSSPAKHKAHVGDTITLHDSTDGDVDVTLDNVAPTARPTDPDFGPDAGKRWFAAQFTIAPAADSKGYSDAPTNGAEAIDSQGQQYDADITAGDITSGHVMGSSVRIVPGSTAKGWLVFEVPASAVITAVQFGLASGFGETGQWLVP